MISSRSLGVLLGCTGLAAGAALRLPAQGAPDGGSRTPAMLPAFVVSEQPIGSFGLSVKATRDPFSPRIAQLIILEVVRHSDADRCGLGPLTQILTIDGRDIHEFAASFDRGSDLSVKLVDRKRGDRIVLEVLPKGAGKSRKVTLVEGHTLQSDSDVDPLRASHIGIAH